MKSNKIGNLTYFFHDSDYSYFRLHAPRNIVGARAKRKTCGGGGGGGGGGGVPPPGITHYL